MAALTLTGGGIALAKIPSSATGKFTGCVNKNTGVLRVINFQAGARCRSGEKTITWSKGWTHRGGWAAGTAYKVGNVVTHNGSSYLAKRRSTGATPAANPAVWGLLAAAGATGATGATGAAGPAGTTGPRGPSNLFIARDVDNAYTNMPAGTPTTLGTLEVPAGNYLVTAQALANNNDASPRTLDCSLSGGSGSPGNFGGGGVTMGEQVVDDREIVGLMMSTVFAATGTITFECTSSATSSNIGKVTVTAVQVENITATVL